MHFEGLISKHTKLKPGSYTLLVTATASGKHSTTGTLHFTIANGEALSEHDSLLRRARSERLERQPQLGVSWGCCLWRNRSAADSGAPDETFRGRKSCTPGHRRATQPRSERLRIYSRRTICLVWTAGARGRAEAQ